MTTAMDNTAPDGENPARPTTQQQPPPRASLVERAAQRMRGDPAAAPAASRPRPQSPPQQPQAPRRPETPESSGKADRRPAPVFIDLDRLQEQGMVTSRGERSKIAEEFRMIKRPLLQEAFTYKRGQPRRANLIMITSALPSEGKSFTTVNLAMSIAKERDVHVLLVDADLSRPNIGETLGVSAEKGLTDLLDDPSLEVSDVLLRTNVPNLSVMLAGHPHAMGTELLASQRATAIFREMAERYTDRVILFDSAPALVSAEGTALSPHVGQVVLIVEAERTTELEVKGALDVLNGCDSVQIILNKVRTHFGMGGQNAYDGYYYYGYGGS